MLPSTRIKKTLGWFLAAFCWLATPVWAGDYLGDLTWPEAQQAFIESPIVILPFGAGAKEHGPHLPMNADRKLMKYLLEQAVAAHPVLVAPPVLHGWFPAFRGYPGTEVANPGIFQDYIHAVAESLVINGARRIVFLNTGIQKATGLPIMIVAREIAADHNIPTLVVSWDDLESDDVGAFQKQKKGGHADEIETAIQLVLQPNAVKQELAAKDYREHLHRAAIGYQPGGFSLEKGHRLYSTTGIYGDATLADEETGRRALAIMTANWLNALQSFAQAPTDLESK